MLVSKHKKNISLTLFASSLALLSTTTNAASINTILTPTSPDIVVSDSGSNGLTKLAINLENNNTTGIWLLMDASNSAINEDFQITTVSNFGPAISDFYFQVVKLDNTEFGSFIPTAEDWTESLTSSNNPSVAPGVGSVTLDPNNSNSSHRFHMSLAPVLPSIQNSTMILNLTADDPSTSAPRFFEQKPWLGFNSQRSQFLLNIDWNEVDVNYEPDPEPVPLPPAVLMFGSAMLGLVGFSRRRKVS